MKENWIIVGLPAAGKTRFASELARLRGLRHVEVDRLFWGAARFEAVLDEVLHDDGWVVEGHFTKIAEKVQPRASRILYLDFPLMLIFFRFLRRNVREPGVPGRSLFRWLRQVSRSRHAFARIPGAKLERLRSPSQARAFLSSLGDS